MTVVIINSVFFQISKENGHPENSVTIYLESHRHNGNLDAQYFLYRSGFRKIEFAYVMPPFAVDMGPSYNLWLTVYKPELIPNYLDEGDAYCGEISSRTVDDFVEELFQETYGEDMESYKDKDCYIEMKNSLQKSEELVVNSCFPWTGIIERSLNVFVMIGLILSSMLTDPMTQRLTIKSLSKN